MRMTMKKGIVFIVVRIGMVKKKEQEPNQENTRHDDQYTKNINKFGKRPCGWRKKRIHDCISYMKKDFERFLLVKKLSFVLSCL